jgi:hypothetical protein
VQFNSIWTKHEEASKTGNERMWVPNFGRTRTIAERADKPYYYPNAIRFNSIRSGLSPGFLSKSQQSAVEKEARCVYVCTGVHEIQWTNDSCAAALQSPLVVFLVLWNSLRARAFPRGMSSLDTS